MFVNHLKHRVQYQVPYFFPKLDLPLWWTAAPSIQLHRPETLMLFLLHVWFVTWSLILPPKYFLVLRLLSPLGHLGPGCCYPLHRFLMGHFYPLLPLFQYVLHPKARVVCQRGNLIKLSTCLKHCCQNKDQKSSEWPAGLTPSSPSSPFVCHTPPSALQPYCCLSSFPNRWM